jgi:uncharacterized protein YbaP (TraB family)
MKTRKVGFLSLAFLLGFLTIGAGVSRDASNRHSLWKATGPRCTLYLLGSIHFLKPENYPLAQPIERAFTNSQVVVFETDIGVKDQPAALAKVMAKAMLPAGESLKAQLSPETYLLLSNYVGSEGLPLDMFTSFRPGIAAMLLEETELQKLGFAADQGVDLHFYNLAVKQGKTVVPLESIDFQLDLLTGFSKEEGELMVKTTIAEIKTTRNLIGDLVAAWQNGDAAKTEKVLNSEKEEAPALYKRLLADRSARWVPKLQELLAGDKNVIVIVGAGHLVGDDGVVELLKKQGVKVVQE